MRVAFSSWRIFKALAGGVLVSVVGAFFAMYALHPYESLWSFRRTDSEFAFAAGAGLVCGIVFTWRGLRGSAFKNEIAKLERTITDGDHLG